MDNFWDSLMETDESASTYMDAYGEGPGSETRQIISEFVNIGESVLDVGCGPGWNMDHFAEYGPRLKRYKGVDYSPRFVRVANKRRKGKSYPSDYALPFEIQDARKLLEPDYSWDIVILQDVLDHLPGYVKPITEAMRVAKKRIIISFWRGQMHDDYKDTGEDLIRDDGNDGWTGEYSREKFENYLDNLGYLWVETQSPPESNRWHRFYIIDLQETYD